MSRIATLKVSLEVWDGRSREIAFTPAPVQWAADVAKKESVSCTGSSFTALSPPSGARYVVIDPGSAPDLTLKGVTGDTGVDGTRTSQPIEAPIGLSLGDSPSLGIANGNASAATVEVWWA